MKYNPFKMLIKLFKYSDKYDPIYHCEVYKKSGCAHVDGLLCNMNTCTMRECNKHRKLQQFKDY